MQALVHFTIGLSGALVVLIFVDWPPQQEFPLIFLSGVWAIVPDGHWLLWELGAIRPAMVWRAIHQTALADVFWFHHVIDSIETGQENLEIALSLWALLVAVFGYYHFNNWNVGKGSSHD
jgi:hypothetical protein